MLQSIGGGSEVHRVTWVGGYYWILALAPRVLVPPGTADPSDPALGGPLEPPGPRSYEQLQRMDSAPRALYLESHAAACARAGLLPTGADVDLLVPFSSSPSDGRARRDASSWSPSFASAVADGLGLGLASVPLAGCCTPTLYCGAPAGSSRGIFGPDADNGTECASYSFGGSRYLNAGWFADTSRRPVYTCLERNATTGIAIEPWSQSEAAGGQDGSSELSFYRPMGGNSSIVFPEILDLSVDPGDATDLEQFDRVTLEGNDLGDDPSDVGILIGGSTCTSPQVCHRTCQECRSPNDCDSNKACVTFGATMSQPSRSVCLPLC